MHRDACPPAAFIAPDGTNREAVCDLFDRLSARLLKALSDAASRPPMPTGDVVGPDAATPTHATTPEAVERLVAEAVEGSMNPAHPGYIGHMDSMPTTASLVGDVVAAGLNNNMLSVELSPFFSRLEAEVVAEFTDRFDLGDDAGGVLLSGGSLSNLQALAVARNHSLGVAESGVDRAAGRPVLFASDVAHTSLQKAAMVLGLGSEAVVPVATNGDSQMRVDALEAAVDEARARGDRPFCVVATAGTTTTGNIDPLPAIQEVADATDLWFHVDAAYGGALVFSKRERDRLAGIEGTDSVTFNPQKWCYVAKTCSMALFRDADVLETAFRIGAPYTGNDDRLLDRGEVSVQGTRHADVLKLWLSLQHLGERGYEQLVDEGYRLREHLLAGVRDRDWLELASEPETNLVCFRAAPDGVPEADRDALNELLQERLLADAEVFLSLPTYRDQRWLRAVLLNPYTDESVLDRLFETVDGVVAEVVCEDGDAGGEREGEGTQ